MKKQVELSITHNGKDVVAYPYSKKEHVQFENGMNIDEFVGQDIATPTITHDTTAIKVGVGDSDVSGSVVDGTVNMTIKGQTYQNILPEPTLRNKMIGKSMQRLNEGYDNIEVVDGVSKSAILKGQTLVNCIKVISYMTTAWPAIKLENVLIQPNKKYIAILKHLPVDCQWAITNIGESQSVHVQYNKAMYSIFTSSSTTTANLLLHINKVVETDLTLEELQKVQPMVIEYQEGMENWDIPYFEGMQSVKMPVLTTTGKNLFELPQSDKMLKGSIGKYIKLNLKPNTNYTYNSILDKKGNTAEFDFYGWISNDTNSNFTGYEVFHWKLNKTFSKTFNTGNDEWYFHVYGEQKGDDYRNYLINFQLEQGSTATSYEPYKTNILHTPEEVVLKGLGDVQDTLNVNTGEYVQRVKEVIYTGEEDGWSSSQMLETPNNISFYIPLDNHLDNTNNPTMRELVKDNLGFTNNCRSATVNEPSLDGKKGFSIHNNGNVYFTIPTSECANLDAWKSRLRTQPLVLQYPVKNPIIKTVDLSSSGNWEKIVYSGASNENWSYRQEYDTTNTYCFKNNRTLTNALLVNQTCPSFSDNLPINGLNVDKHSLHINGQPNVMMKIDKKLINEPTDINLRQYLQQNPITVWYQTSTTVDSTQVKQPIFFKDGHIQLSSGADNSLIPTLDYQAKTSNSYMMDLMKTNTKYTMKAKSASGTFTIDGTSYNVNANGIFTTPTSMTNKLLVMSNKTNEEVMIIEGDVVSKTIPYFKGIKSAFEDEDKVEVLSTGKNLFDGAFEKGVIDANGNLGYAHTAIRTVNYISVKPNTSYHINLPNLELFETLRVLYVHEYDENFKVLGEVQVGNRNIYTSKSATKFIKINTHTAHDLPVDSKMIVCENSTLDKQYEPYKSNSTKIPLLHPLRSLPNGVCDELIIDRLNHKAKLIQRIGYEVLNENTAFSSYSKMEKEKTLLFQTQNANPQGASTYCISDQFIHRNNLWNSSDSDTEGIMMGGNKGNTGKHIDFRISKAKVSTNNVTILQDYLSKEPITVLYQLNIPIITEIDLEGYPYIYKDGHIFLNSDIAPTTQITYSINQAQQIESANENLQRHEKEISRLQKLIAQYIQVEYESTLLSLKL